MVQLGLISEALAFSDVGLYIRLVLSEWHLWRKRVKSTSSG